MNAHTTMIGAGLLALNIAPKTLADALAALKAPGANIIEKRNSIPILGCVLLVARGDCLTIQGTDLDMILSIECPIAGDGDGALAVEFDALEAAVKAAKGETIRIVDSGDGKAIVQSDNRTARLPTRDASDFPLLIPGDGLSMDKLFSIDPAALKQDLDRLAPSVSTEATRYYLNGVFWHITGDGYGNSVLRMASTDGHRLGVIERPAPEGVQQFPDAIMPRKAAEWMRRRALKGATGSCRLGFTGSKFVFQLGRMRLVGKLIDGTFPDYSRVIPRTARNMGMSNIIAGDADAMATAAIEASAQQSAKLRPFLISAGDGWGTAYSYCPDNGAASALIDGVDFIAPTAGIGGDDGPAPVDFGACFNSKYFADVMGTFKGQRVTIAMENASCPALIESEGAPEFLAVLMPMRGDNIGTVKTPDDLRKLNRDAMEIFQEDGPGLVESTARALAELETEARPKSNIRARRKELKAKLGAMLTAAINLTAARIGGDRYAARCTVLTQFAAMQGLGTVDAPALVQPADAPSAEDPAPVQEPVDVPAAWAPDSIETEMRRVAGKVYQINRGGFGTSVFYNPADIDGTAQPGVMIAEPEHGRSDTDIDAIIAAHAEPEPAEPEGDPDIDRPEPEPETAAEYSARIRASKPMFANMQAFKAAAGQGTRWTIESFSPGHGWNGLRTVTVATVRARSIGFLRGEHSIDACRAADIAGFGGRTWIDFPGKDDWSSDPDGLITYYQASEQSGRASRAEPCLRIRPVAVEPAGTATPAAPGGDDELSQLRETVAALCERLARLESAAQSVATEEALPDVDEPESLPAPALGENSVDLADYVPRAEFEAMRARAEAAEAKVQSQAALIAAYNADITATDRRLERHITRTARLTAVLDGRKRQLASVGQDLLYARTRAAQLQRDLAETRAQPRPAPVAIEKGNITYSIGRKAG